MFFCVLCRDDRVNLAGIIRKVAHGGSPPRHAIFFVTCNFSRDLWFFCKKIHRYFVLATLVTAICMIGTGVMMHENEYLILSAVTARSFHNQISILFSIELCVMLITGSYLFLFPYLPTKKEPPKQVN